MEFLQSFSPKERSKIVRKAMRNGWKRVCAVALAAAMTVTMLPVSAQAAGKEADTPQLEPIEIVENGDFSDGTSKGWKEFEQQEGLEVKLEIEPMDDFAREEVV